LCVEVDSDYSFVDWILVDHLKKKYLVKLIMNRVERWLSFLMKSYRKEITCVEGKYVCSRDLDDFLGTVSIPPQLELVNYVPITDSILFKQVEEKIEDQVIRSLMRDISDEFMGTNLFFSVVDRSLVLSWGSNIISLNMDTKEFVASFFSYDCETNGSGKGLIDFKNFLRIIVAPYIFSVAKN